MVLIQLTFEAYGPYIKYVGGEAGGFYKFFKKCFVSQRIKELNIPWSSSFFVISFVTPPINFSLLFKGALSGLMQFLATESPLKIMKNAFYFNSKALFLLKIFKFSS